MGYPRGTKGYLLYDPKEQRVLVSTNARFLEQDYMLNKKPRSKVVLDELRAELGEGNEVKYQKLGLINHKLFVHKRQGCLVVVGGLLHNLSISLAWEKSQ